VRGTVLKTCRIVLVQLFLPALLLAQAHNHSQPLRISTPGITTRLERFAPLSISDNPQLGNVPIDRLAVDRRGFLWVGTIYGLARFDGYDLKIYHEDAADSSGTFKVQVQAIAVDGDGFVWGGTAIAGMVRLDPVTGQTRWYRGRETDSSSIGNGAYRLFVSADGALWAATRFGLAKYNRESDTFIRYNLPSDFPRRQDGESYTPYTISSICELGPSIFVGLVGGGLGELNRDTGVWKRYMHKPGSGDCPSFDIIRAVCPDRQGRLWMSTRNTGLDCYDPQTGVWRHFSVSSKGIQPYKIDNCPEECMPIWSMVQDSLGGLWLTSLKTGIFRLDQATGNYSLFRHDSTDANSLPYDSHTWLGAQYISEEGRSKDLHGGTSIVWIPSGAEGMYRIIVRRDPSTGVSARPVDGTLGFLITALMQESPGRVWAAQMNARLALFDLRSRTLELHPEDPLDVYRVGGPTHLALLPDRNILMSTQGFKTWILDQQNDSFVPFVQSLRVGNFLAESDSLLWLGCRSALGMSFIAAINRQTGTYIAYPRQDSDSSSHRDETVTSMCTDGNGGLWYGTAGGGLIRFDMKLKTYRRFAAQSASENSLNANGVYALLPETAVAVSDSRQRPGLSTGDWDRLWVGTEAGLARMECSTGTFEHFHNTLPQNRDLWITGIVDDGVGRLWIAAHQGAFCFTKATRSFRRLTPPSLLPNVYFRAVMFEPLTRTVTFGGANGFFSFAVDDPPPASAPSSVVLTSFKVFDKDYPLDADISTLTSITLPYSASFFSFTFAVLDFLDPAKNQYAYKLEGVDREWVQAGTRRYVSYTNLDPGKYRLTVRGSNSDGIWSEKPTEIEIIILPPWYRTTWAYLAYFLGFLGILYVLRAFDRRRAELKHSLELKSFEAAKMGEVDQLKSAFFANISHEFRTPLTLILGPLEQFAERFKHDEQAQATVSMMRRNGLRLLQLINQLLDLSRMDAGKMSLQVRPLELVALSRSLVMSFQSFAERKKIVLIFDPEEDEIIAYSDRDKFDKILTNLISNALKFTGEGGEVKVVLRITPGAKDKGTVLLPPCRRIELVVSDTGIGIAPSAIPKVFDRFYQVESAHTQAQDGTGIGLALAKELVELMRGQITVQSTPGHGSTFVVQLPIGKEEWRPEEIAAEEQLAETRTNSSAAAIIDEEPPSEEQHDSRAHSKPQVLVVEDNADVRNYIRGFLEKEFDILEAENGKEGLEKALEAGPDLAISDVMMPVMDGVQLCRELKGDDRTSHIPVILLTSKATTEGTLEGLEIGADDYILKPFEARELMARAKNLIETRKRLWKKYHQQVTFGPGNVAVTSTDGRFLKRLSELIEEHIADNDYDTEALAHDICMSRMQLNRKLNALTGHSTHEVVREFRLQRAAKLLRGQAGNITGVAYDVGFNSLSHFARAFRERFGVVPSEYAAHTAKNDGNVI
jgi:signal transduction histidine kinase/CheY-like chemotaxis protein/AraC-like DNA-binding protein/ligand-binding sensor domain-containing protein